MPESRGASCQVQVGRGMAASIFICFLAFLLLASTAVTQDTYQFGEMSGPVLLILGAGNRVGALTAKFFAQKGYRVALVSRSVAADDYPSHLTIKADLADPKSVGSVFQKVREALGEPNVVVYNGMVSFSHRSPLYRCML